jgi:hypothetical protein
MTKNSARKSSLASCGVLFAILIIPLLAALLGLCGRFRFPWAHNVHENDVVTIAILDSEITLIRRGDTEQ